ncbi:MAG: hypothetical protein HQ518_13810 [Rhodopirellula sp.]|nr:hypothetical protein [Rhodopirellula sp.]
MSQRNDSGTSSPSELDEAFTKVLGYLNFSNGKSDVDFLGQLNHLAVFCGVETSWEPLQSSLNEQLKQLAGSNPAFSDAAQATAALSITFDALLPAYLEFHSDLLFHLKPADFVNPLFLGRCFEAVLEQGGPWNEVERVVAGALERLNDYLGYRPVPVLENGRKMMPYDHERFRPLPLYIEGAGVSPGDHQPIIEKALAMLKSTPSDVLIGAHFDLANLSELALDVRAYDHDHPVYKRTNYLFGEWDPHLIDNKGDYRRFVIRKIIFDALIEWVSFQVDQEEAIFDAGAVLCGTILMASAISGDGPSCHDSTTTLTSLLPVVARQRDDFYARLMSSQDGNRAKRLIAEAKATQQPFGHVRQALNLHLAHFGARQVQYRQLANLYARMGHSEAAREQAAIIPSVSARFECEVQWRITSALGAIDRNDIELADKLLLEVEGLVVRAVHCGAFVDPWNILGFQGNFPLFQSREDSIPDQRVEILLDLMERIFGAFSRALGEAAAQGQKARVDELTARFEKLAEYWDQFAAHVIDDLPKVFGGESLESARHVAEALSDWRAAGEAAGDISFWRKHVSRFTSAKSYACVVETLLSRGDSVAAMALLVQWLSVSDEVGIESGQYSIHALLIDWINRVTTNADGSLQTPGDWASIRRLFDFLEANAGEYWEVPQLESFGGASSSATTKEPGLEDWDVDRDEKWLDEEDDEDNIFEAAYEGIVFKDSTDDGNEGEVLDSGTIPGNTEFEILNRHLEPRIKFVMALAQLWQIAATALAAEFQGAPAAKTAKLSDEQVDTLTEWSQRVRRLQEDLLKLLTAIWEQELDETGGDHDANVEYDIQLQTKFYLLNTVIATHINCRVAEVGLLCLLPPTSDAVALPEEDRQMIEFYRAVMSQDVQLVSKLLAGQFHRLSRKPLLYVPLDNGGHPTQILVARTVQTDIRFLLKQLPRLGLFRETWHVVRLAHRMERETRPDQMSVTEFDRIFRTALRNTIECIVESSETWDNGNYSDERLTALVSEILGHYREQWHRHSRTMRLSSVEGLRHDVVWEDVKEFVEVFGDDLFHARSLTLGNVRTILHNGVDWFIAQLAEHDDPLHPSRLVEALEAGDIDIDDAVEILELIYGSVVDKFDRFLEYNTTTTQSDYGDKFYVLLDFLRVEAVYDRGAWERIPDSIVHRSLAMAGKQNALALLEDSFEEDSREEANRHVESLQKLEREYGVHLPGVADRINERFTKPLAVNRMLALVKPAMRPQIDDKEAYEKFALLRREIESYMEDTAGSAIDIPQWLQDVGREVNRLEAPSDYIRPPELELRLPILISSESSIREQLETWSTGVAAPERKRRKKSSRKRPQDDNDDEQE